MNLTRYAVYAGMNHCWEVWTEDEHGAKQTFMAGYPTSDEAHAARKRFIAGDERRAAQ